MPAAPIASSATLSTVLDPVLAVALPALFAGIVAVLATVVVERLGGVLGGVLSSIPTTVVPFAIGSYTRAADVDDFRHAMAFVPIGILLNALYLVWWRVVPATIGRRTRSHLLAKTTAIGLFAWLVCATAIVVIDDLVDPTVGAAIAAGIAACIAGAILGVSMNWRPHPAPKGTRRVGPLVLAIRGVAATFVIGNALHLARLGLPVASGIASVVPVIFTTIMVATWLAQGPQVPTGAVGPMTLGTLSVSAYALLAIWLFPLMDLALAATLCWIGAVVLVSIPTYAFVGWARRRNKVAHAPA